MLRAMYRTGWPAALLSDRKASHSSTACKVANRLRPTTVVARSPHAIARSMLLSDCPVIAGSSSRLSISLVVISLHLCDAPRLDARCRFGDKGCPDSTCGKLSSGKLWSYPNSKRDSVEGG